PELEDVRQQARDWIVRMQSGAATTDDGEELLRWRARSPGHAQALGEAVRLHRRIVEATAGQRISDPEPIPARPVRALPAPTALRRPVLGRRAFVAGAVAASAAGVLAIRPPMALWPSLAELGSDYRTQAGKQRTVALARGVSVQLNTRTSLALRSDAGH